MNTQVDTYQQLDLETGVAAASPQRLVVMLYDGAIKAIHAARAALARHDIAGRGASISKAIAIVDEGLRPALDLNAGGEIAANLAGLYEYIVNRLLYANLKQDDASLDEAVRLLGELKAAWEALDRKEHTNEEPAPAEQWRPALSYGRI